MARIYNQDSILGQAVDGYTQGHESYFKEQLAKRQQAQSEAKDRNAAEEFAEGRYKKAKVKDGLVDGYESDTVSRGRDIPLIQKLLGARTGASAPAKPATPFKDILPSGEFAVKAFQAAPGPDPMEAEAQAMGEPAPAPASTPAADPLAWISAETKRRKSVGNMKPPTMDEANAAIAAGQVPDGPAPVMPLIKSSAQHKAESEPAQVVGKNASGGDIKASQSILEAESSELRDAGTDQMGRKVLVPTRQVQKFDDGASVTAERDPVNSLPQLPPMAGTAPAFVPPAEAPPAPEPEAPFDPSDAYLAQLAKASTTIGKRESAPVVVGSLPENLQRILLGKQPGEGISAQEQAISISADIAEKVLSQGLKNSAGGGGASWAEFGQGLDAVMAGEMPLEQFLARNPNMSKTQATFLSNALGRGERKAEAAAGREERQTERSFGSEGVSAAMEAFRTGDSYGGAIETFKNVTGRDPNRQERSEIARVYENAEKEKRANIVKPEKIRTRLTPSESEKLSSLKSAYTSMSALAETLRDPKFRQKFGPATGFIGGLNKYDKDAQDLDGRLRGTMQTGGKAEEGGVLRAEDEKKYAKQYPGMEDTYEGAILKYREKSRQLLRKYRDTIEPLAAQGYDVSAFENMPFDQLEGLIDETPGKGKGVAGGVAGFLNEAPKAIIGGSSPKAAPADGKETGGRAHYSEPAAKVEFDQELSKARELMTKFRRETEQQMAKAKLGGAWASRRINERKAQVDAYLKEKFGKGYSEDLSK